MQKRIMVASYCLSQLHYSDFDKYNQQLFIIPWENKTKQAASRLYLADKIDIFLNTKLSFKQVKFLTDKPDKSYKQIT